MASPMDPGEVAVAAGARRFSLRICFVVLLYGAFFYTGGVWIWRKRLYRDVEKWPSVPASNVSEAGWLSTHTNYWRGGNTWTMDTRKVSFEYSIDGRTYVGDTFSPDGDAPSSGFPADTVWRAYYRTDDPEIAVLLPRPYEGHLHLLCGVIAGMGCVVHATCAFADWRSRRGKRRSRTAGSAASEMQRFF